MGWVVVIRNWLRLSNNLTVSAAKQRARSNSMASWSNAHAPHSPALKHGNSECMHVMHVQVLRYGKYVGALLTPLTVPCTETYMYYACVCVRGWVRMRACVHVYTCIHVCVCMYLQLLIGTKDASTDLLPVLGECFGIVGAVDPGRYVCILVTFV